MNLTPVLFEWLLTSAFLILAVLALRALLGKRISAGLRYALWAVVLVRLLVPVQLFPSPTGTSIMRETGMEEFTALPAGWTVPAPAASYTPASTTELPDGTLITCNTAPAPVTVRVEPLTVLQVLGWLWLAGSAAMAAAFILSNVSFALRLGRVRTRMERTDCPLPVYAAPGLPSPCLFGLLRPAVYITPETAADPDMLRHVLAHEYTHASHGDHIWNLLRSAALAVHWWNPLVWLSVALSRRDCELACDEGALKRLGEGERFAYGRTLLALITEKPRPRDLLRCATTMTGGEKSVWERVNRIARSPKRWLWAAAAVVLATALACVCAFGSAAQQPLFDIDSLTTDNLVCSIWGSDFDNPVVRIDGSIGDVELTRGAFWYPETVWREDSSSELSMVYPAFTDGIEAHITAWWADEAHASVTMSTDMTAMLSSFFNVGYWEFTVDLDKGTVTKMAGTSFREGLPDAETRFYPRAISNEEAVKAACVAAKLMSEAEDYYAYANPSHCFNPYREVLLGNVPFHYMANGAYQRDIYVTDIPGLLPNHDETSLVCKFSVVDMDGDGTNEVVLHVSNSGEHYAVLYQVEGQVYGFTGQWAHHTCLKADGTFWRSGYSDSRLVTYRDLPAQELTELASSGYEDKTQEFGHHDVFSIAGLPVTEEEYDEFLARQYEKPDALWQSFIRQNIRDTFPE